MKIAVRCFDGSKRMYVLDQWIDPQQAIALTKAEVPVAKTVLVQVRTKHDAAGNGSKSVASSNGE